jgi:hypothetical protein
MASAALDGDQEGREGEGIVSHKGEDGDGDVAEGEEEVDLTDLPPELRMDEYDDDDEDEDEPDLVMNNDDDMDEDHVQVR